MNLLYVSCICSNNKYMKLFNESEKKPSVQGIKYNRLLAEGISKQDNIKITTLSALGISRYISKKIFWGKQEENIDNIKYVYAPFINLPIIRQLTLMIYSFVYVMSIKNKNDFYIINDILSSSISIGALIASKLKNIPNIGIITDLPEYLTNNRLVKIQNYIINNQDAYIFLTEEMNKKLNVKNKPYIVIEGSVDINMNECKNKLEDKYKKKVCIYAGAIQKIYGIRNLVYAFIKANINDSELHIYGDGDFREELEEICKYHNCIKYFGVKDNNFVVKEELKATLLINPRPSNEEYTKYSFPSKNMEYMVSGTPVLTTMLPGMPIEYNKYVYLFKDETENGLIKTLNEVCGKPLKELHDKGNEAKTFVINQKNNVIQAKKILSMIEKI